MMRTNFLLLGLVTLMVIIGLYMGSDPEQAAKLDEMRRNAAFTGEARETVLLLLAVGLGAFIGYLALTRR